jgi:diketogulonate reductase-like aldo/keto reductase
MARTERSRVRRCCAGATVQPALIQNRCYVSDFWDGAVREFCGARGTIYQGFSLLTANRQHLDSPVIRAMQQRTGRSVEELVFAFATQIGICALTGTIQESHMRLDLAVLGLRFEQSELAAIETIAGAQQ